MSAGVKRKCVVLLIEDKLKVIDMLKTSSQKVVAERFGVGKNTISDIKKNQLKILAFSSEMVNMGMTRKAKVMCLGDNVELDKAVYLWFRQKRMDGIPISGPMLCEKAINLSKRMFGDEASFIANEGWKWHFCKRHGIRNLSLQGEKLSADNEGAESLNFVTSFHAFVEENRSCRRVGK